MTNQFSKIMSQRTDQELIEIVTIRRNDYEPLAIEAAEQEINSRNIDSKQIVEIEQVLTSKMEEQIAFEEVKVTPLTRFVHCLVDLFAFILLTIILSFAVGTIYNPETDFAVNVAGYTTMLIAFLSYFIIFEYSYQKTLGKFITKTKVVTANGEIPTLGDIVRRTFCRLIPFDNVSFLFTKNGFHDSLSNTTVVKEI